MSDDHNSTYFPDRVSKFRQQWYSANLAAMGEPSLFDTNPDSRFVCRFLWICFDQPPLCIRIDTTNEGQATVTVKQTNGKGGFTVGELVLSEQAPITAYQLSKVMTLFKNTDFWRLPTTEKLPIGTDGEEWVFEAREDERYHIVDRWCPDVLERDRPLLELGEYLKTLAEGLSIEAKLASGA